MSINKSIHFYKNALIGGRPLFTDTYSSLAFSPKKSLAVQNAMLLKLRPTKEKWRITRLLEKMISSLTQFFVITRPNVMKGRLPWIIRAGGSHSLPPASVSFGNLWTHYNRFLKGDKQCSHGFKESFQRLEKNEEAIQSLNLKQEKLLVLKKEKSTPKNQTEIKKIEEERKLFIQKKLTEIYQLKVGSSQLLLLNREGTSDQTINANLFCIITKQSPEKFTLRFLGSGSLMRELQVVPTGGKDKVMRELCFENIPKNAVEKKGLQKQMQLRSEILTLFDLFQNLRDDLRPYSEDYHILAQVFKGISSKVNRAYDRGYSFH